MRFHRLPLVATALFLVVAGRAHAAANDINLLGLVDRPAGAPATVKQTEFRSLVRELGLVFTPTMNQPAETTGLSGFDFALDYAFHPMNTSATYWQSALEDPGVRLPMTIGARARKGFVLPVPLASEVEFGALWLIESQMVDLVANVRVALNEGFRFLPDIAVSTGINRVVGSDDLDLLTVTAGGSISKGFGVFGTFNLCPYVGYQSIWVNGSTRIVDTDPSNAANVDDNVVFDIVPLADNRIDRVSGGLRVVVAHIMISAGVDANYVDANAPLLQYGTRVGASF